MPLLLEAFVLIPLLRQQVLAIRAVALSSICSSQPFEHQESWLGLQTTFITTFLTCIIHPPTAQNMVFSPLELPSTSSIDLFNALDEASEYTFLRGRTDVLVQRVCISSRNLGDEGYLVGLLAFMLEDRLVAAWMKSKEEGALRNHRALIEEEEEAQKK